MEKAENISLNNYSAKFIKSAFLILIIFYYFYYINKMNRKSVAGLNRETRIAATGDHLKVCLFSA